MTSDAIALFSRTLSTSTQLPGAYLWEAYRLAKRTRNLDLMRLLVKRGDTPAELYEIYRKDRRAEVKAAFLLRKGLTQDEMKAELLNEARAGVLGPVLRNFQGDYPIKPLVEGIFLERPTKALAEFMLDSEDHKVVITSLNVLAQTFDKIGPGLLGKISVALGVLMADADPLALFKELPGAPYQSTLLIEHMQDLNEERMLEILPGVFDNILSPRPQVLINHYHRDYIQLEVINKLENWFDQKPSQSVLNVLKETQDKAWGPNSKIQVDKLLATYGEVDENEVFEFDTEPGRIRAATVLGKEREAELDILIDGAVQRDEARVVTALLSNPSLNAAQIDKLMESRMMSHVSVRAYSSIAMAHKGNLKLLLHLYRSGASFLIQDIGYAPWENVQAAQEMLIEDHINSIKSAGGPYSRYGYAGSHNIEIMATAKDADVNHLLSILPWPIASQSYGPKILGAIMNRQLEVFKDCPEAWETFAVLAADFSGTVEEILQASKALAA